MTDYIDVCEYLSSKFDRVNGYNFYRDIFPNNEITGELNTNYSKPNAIYLYQDENKKMKRRIMLNDTWEEDYMSYVECNPMTLCSGLTYRGRTNKLEHAQQMNALIFDIDDEDYKYYQEVVINNYQTDLENGFIQINYENELISAMNEQLTENEEKEIDDWEIER